MDTLNRVHHVVSSVVQPVIVLRGFKRLHLEPGASTTVSFEHRCRDQLAQLLDAQMRKKVESGPVDVLVDFPSSAETSSIRLTVQDPDLTPVEAYRKP